MTHSFPTRRSSDLRREPDHRRRLDGGVGARRHVPSPPRRRGPMDTCVGPVGCWCSWMPACAGMTYEGRPGSAYDRRSEEHTSELQSLMRISYAVFCLKKKNNYI